MRAMGWVINKKKVQRLWCEEGLRVKVRKIRNRAGASTTLIAEAHALKVVWAIDFQFDSTTDGRKFKIASMVDEHTRQSVLNMVERSIPAEDLVAALEGRSRSGPSPNPAPERLQWGARYRIDSDEFYRLLEGEVIDDANLFAERLQQWEDHYNYDRPHGALSGQTPYERLKQKARDPLS
ncbi:integrase core domain-containing protein [Rhodococcus cerastii]|nr:integrase core domain-containing protein [Rhodococcus cerastii]